MKVPFAVGVVGHFGLAVRSPKRSAKWFERALGLKKQFEFEDGVAIGNDNVTIALHKGKPSPGTLATCPFICRAWPRCEKHWPIFGNRRSSSKIRATRSGRKRRVRRTRESGSTTPTVIAGNSTCREAVE